MSLLTLTNFNFQAGHCVFGGAQYFEIYLGVINLSGPVSWGARVFPRDVFLHQEYNDLTLNNDIAMMRLVDAPENLFDDPFVAAIPLPDKISNLAQQAGTIVSISMSRDYINFWNLIFFLRSDLDGNQTVRQAFQEF